MKKECEMMEYENKHKKALKDMSVENMRHGKETIHQAKKESKAAKTGKTVKPMNMKMKKK